MISEPYRIPQKQRVLVARSLARGLRPLAWNAIVLALSFAAVLYGATVAIDPVIAWIEGRIGPAPLFNAYVVAPLLFAVPWLAIYLVWRTIWRRIVMGRVAARQGPEGDLVATLDENGVTVGEKGSASNWLAWSAVSHLLLLPDVLVVARGTFGLMVPLGAISGRAALAGIAAWAGPAALAASNWELRDALR